METAGLRRAIKSGIFIVMLTLMVACATAQKNTEPEKVETSGEFVGPPEPYGPPISSDQTQDIYGPNPTETVRPLILVLSPGIARGYAHAGVLLALHEAKIPVQAIVATEMGAFIAILYGLHETISGFEWALMKFKENVFLKKNNIISSVFKGSDNGKKIEELLLTLVGGKKLEQSRIPLRVLLETERSGTLTLMMVGEGDAVQAARASVAFLGLIQPGNFGKEKATPATLQRPFPVSEAKLMGEGPVLVVDTTGEAGSRDLLEADLVLRPDLVEVGPLDFQKRTEAIFRGKRAVLNHLVEIKQLVGISNQEVRVVPHD